MLTSVGNAYKPRVIRITKSVDVLVREAKISVENMRYNGLTEAANQLQAALDHFEGK